MKEYKNTSKPFGIIIDKKTYDFENGEIVAVPDNFKERAAEHIAKLEDVTKDEINVFDEYMHIKRVPRSSVTESKATVPIELKEVRHTKKSLSKLSFSKLKKIGKGLGIKFRGKKEGIKEILEAQ